MKTLNELYIILWDEIKGVNYFNGLCGDITRLQMLEKIKNSERIKLNKHFNENKPNKNLHSEFLKRGTWIGKAWWWNTKEITNPINRKAFVQK
jgi:hypothetical protein